MILSLVLALVTYNLLPISSGVMSASTKSGRSFGKALTFNYGKRKSPPAITPLELPMIFTGTSIVISLSKI
jgi:hypothetical protein